MAIDFNNSTKIRIGNQNGIKAKARPINTTTKLRPVIIRAINAIILATILEYGSFNFFPFTVTLVIKTVLGI